MFKSLLQTISRILQLNSYCTNSQTHIIGNYIHSFAGIEILFKNNPAL